MKKKLFQEVFKKAENQSGQTRKHSLANYLSDLITNDFNHSTNSITFVRYYEKYIEDDESITSNPKADLLNKVSEYLNYDSYEDFVTRNRLEEKKKDDEKPPLIGIINSGESNGEGRSNNTGEYQTDKVFFNWMKNNRKIVAANSIILVIVISIISSDIISKSGERWMTWQKDHYVEVKFSITKYYNDELEMYDKQKLKTFKQILEPDCDTKYRNAKGDWILWYYRRGKNDLDIFTSSGVHPVNGKDLKRITLYMIKEHICEDYK
ncbi:MAG: hypothetical protein JXR05_12475 [Flavobacteriaceae bacterium]